LILILIIPTFWTLSELLPLMLVLIYSHITMILIPVLIIRRSSMTQYLDLPIWRATIQNRMSCLPTTMRMETP
jgi:hypothetical protein